jgi:hypothetical protein
MKSFIAAKKPQPQFLYAGLMVLVIASGCAINTIIPEYPLPSQSIDARPATGQVKVVLFNDSNRFLYGLDGSGKINVILAGKNVASLQIGAYVQIFVDPGEYDLLLAHRDMATFENRYRLRVQGDAVFVKIYSQPISTDFEIVDALPAEFRPAFP